MINHNESDNKPFVAALAQMSEPELARILSIVESLEQDFQRIPIRAGEAIIDAAAAQKLLEIWNDEVQSDLAVKQRKDTIS